MTKFLFWNLNKKSLQDSIARLANYYDVDVIMLAECNVGAEVILRALNQTERSAFHYGSANSLCNSIKVFMRFESDFIPIYEESERLSIRHLRLPGLEDILLAVVHIPSKSNFRDGEQLAYCIELVKEVKSAEERIGHSRTALVGDLNMNPFEDGLILANALHCVSSKHEAQKISRIVQRKEYQYFYNPMWNLLGDLDRGPCGTYYYRGNYRSFFWNMFDQVLVRPQLLDHFIDHSLQIVTFDGVNQYLSNNHVPDKINFSDHLPIIFQLDL